MKNELVPHKPSWKSDFRRESAAITVALSDLASKIHHIGSTSISGIYAKPIIDILIEVYSVKKIDSRNDAMIKLGYECLGEYGIPDRRYFRKISLKGTRTHHVHMFELNSKHVIRHIAFRDYLIAHPKKAQEYSSLKQALFIKSKNDWDLYLDGKDPFINETELIALDWYKNRV